MNSEKHRSVKNLLLNPKFQLRFIGYFVALFVITTISLYSTTFIFFWSLNKKALSAGIPDGHVFYQFLETLKSDMDLLFISLAVFNFLLLFTVGFIISHRIAGPLKKMQTHLSDPEQTGQFSLRDKDFFPELVPMVNDVKLKIKK